LLGWYHPYERIFNKALNYCVWFPIQNFESARARTFGAAVVRELGAMQGGFHIRRLFVNLCRQSMTNSLSLVTNETYGVVLLHLPTPHLPGIYLPEQDRFTVLGIPRVQGYFNNLALADQWLGKLRRALDGSSQSTNTWLIVSSDHSWRESRLYDKVRDLRVPFLVKAPGQTRGEVYSPQFDTVLTHDLILAILRKEVTSGQDVVPWLDRHRSDFIKPPDSHGEL
ncbi:MAG TPA: sulfatase-like hydrolase/transferase, partial [Verrucomicrobiae bacterium]|nr:sulfatase-like hydrolase/transferase [Verrucomicrobiae bacterium]